MYAGNHSPCHPLNTILGAAKKLSERSDIAFCFVGGGSEFARVKNFAKEHRLANVICLPYQPIEQLSSSLSAADLHLVVMGNPFVGMVHPCKIYNIMQVGAPLLYVGPTPSHISRILDETGDGWCSAAVNHGESDQAVQHILRIKETTANSARNGLTAVTEKFSTGRLLPRLVQVLEQAGANN
jgi:glycosyltransferase involved in cell wall biosynthesis